MNKFFKTVSLIAIAATIVIVLGAQAVRALREAVAPPPLPYAIYLHE